MGNSITQIVYPNILSSNDIPLIENNRVDINFLSEWNIVHNQLNHVDMSFIWLFIEEDNQARRMKYNTLELTFEKSLNALLTAKSLEIDVLIVPFHNQKLTRLSINLQKKLHRIQTQYANAEVLALLPEHMPSIHIPLLSANHHLFANRFTKLFIKKDQLIHSNPYINNVPSQRLNTFRSFIFDYDYIAALEVINTLPESQIKANIQAFLWMMINRFNFAFEEANKYTNDLINDLGRNDILLTTQEVFQTLIGNDDKMRDLFRIQELTRHMETMMERNQTFSFLVRFYRLREAILFYLFNHASDAESFYFDQTTRKSIYERYEDLEELYGLHDIRQYFGCYFFIKSTNVNQAILYRNRSFIGHNRQPIDRDNFWKAYAGNDRMNLKKAKYKFQNDLSVLLKDLGLEKDHHIDDLNEWILAYSRKLEGGDGTYTNNSLSS